MHSIVLESRRHSPALIAISALLVAYYSVVWRGVYSLGVPTGVASTVAQVLPLLTLATAVYLGLRHAQRGHIALFVSLSLGGGLGGALGSIFGNAFGRAGLFAGGVVGGIIVTTGVVLIAKKLGWISGRQLPLTVSSAVVGFFAAAVVAATTLSSPVGPIASSALIGAAGLWGAWLSTSIIGGANP